MYYSYVEIEYVAMSFSPARTDLAVKLLSRMNLGIKEIPVSVEKDVCGFVLSPICKLFCKQLVTVPLQPTCSK
jgi:hypothetical protein